MVTRWLRDTGRERDPGKQLRPPLPPPPPQPPQPPRSPPVLPPPLTTAPQPLSTKGVAPRPVRPPPPRPKTHPSRHGVPQDLVPPDGGWGWMIVLANCMLTFVLPSVSTCFGVVYVDLVLSRGHSNAAAATVPALLAGVSNILGPFSTALSRHYGHRVLCLVGVVFVAFGTFVCAFCYNIIIFCIFYGVLGGIGLALASPHGFILSQKYFKTRRVAANGLSMLGMSMGCMILPSLLQYLLTEYSSQGMLLLWSGIILQGLIGASLYQPVEWHMKPRKEGSPLLLESGLSLTDVPQNEVMQTTEVKSCFPDDYFEDRDPTTRDSYSSDDDSRDSFKDVDDDFDEEDEESDSGYSQQRFLFSSDEELSRFGEELLSSSLHIENREDFAISYNFSNRGWKNPLTDTLQTNEFFERPRTVSVERSMEILPQIPEETEEECFEEMERENERIHFLNLENEAKSRPMSFISARSVDSFATAHSMENMCSCSDLLDQFGSALSLETTDAHRCKINEPHHHSQIQTLEPTRNGCLQEFSRVQDLPKENYVTDSSIRDEALQCCWLRFPRFSEVVNFRLLSNSIFLIASISSISNRLVYISMVTYLPALGMSLGVNQRAALLVAVVAGAELLAKMMMTAITDRGWFTRRHLYIIAGISSTSAIIVLTASRDMTFLSLCCAWYGFSAGMSMSVGPVLLVEYLGVKLLPYSYGVLLFMNGITGLLLFPFTGWLTDITGHYQTLFYVLGSLSFIPVFLWSIAPFVQPTQGDDCIPPQSKQV